MKLNLVNTLQNKKHIFSREILFLIPIKELTLLITHNGLRGPYSVGGRTRAILFDPNDATGKRVFAGGVSGGLWVNNDITNSSSEWSPINDFWANTSISCIASDPNNPKLYM